MERLVHFVNFNTNRKVIKWVACFRVFFFFEVVMYIACTTTSSVYCCTIYNSYYANCIHPDQIGADPDSTLSGSGSSKTCPIFIISHCIEMYQTSWTYSSCQFQIPTFHYQGLNISINILIVYKWNSYFY